MDARGIRILPQKKEGTPMRKVTAQRLAEFTERDYVLTLSLIHISEPTRRTPISYAVFCLKKKKKPNKKNTDNSHT